jgi:hypothetical protein
MSEIDKAIKICKEEIKFYKNELKDSRFKEHLSPEEDYCKGRSEVYCKMQNSIKTFEFIIQNLEEKQKREWIPVSERLPERFVDVLCTNATDKWVSMGNYDTAVREWYDVRDDYCTIGVTHWMPLPEPYKEAKP